MIRKLGDRLAAFFRKTTPDPFILAVFLTVVVFVLAAVIEGKGPVERLQRAFGPACVLVLEEPRQSNRVAFAWTGAHSGRADGETTLSQYAQRDLAKVFATVRGTLASR